MDPLQDQEITYISGVADSGEVAATSYLSWNGAYPEVYGPTSQAVKWGNTTIGTSGGDVTYFFDTASNWTPDEQSALTSGLRAVVGRGQHHVLSGRQQSGGRLCFPSRYRQLGLRKQQPDQRRDREHDGP